MGLLRDKVAAVRRKALTIFFAPRDVKRGFVAGHRELAWRRAGRVGEIDGQAVSAGAGNGGNSGSSHFVLDRSGSAMFAIANPGLGVVGPIWGSLRTGLNCQQ